MSINENIWGDSESWVSCLNSLCKTSDKTAYQLIDDTLPMNELIDNSMCWCGIAQNLHKFHLAHSAITNNADFSPLVFKPLYKTEDVINVPFMLALGGSYFEYTFDFHNMNGRWAQISSLSDGNMDWYITGQAKPIFNLQLNKLIFVPTVTVFADTDPANSSFQTYSLSDWIHTQHTTYPYLAQLFIEPYYNAGTEEEPRWQLCYDSYDHYEYFIPNLETSDYIQDLPDSNFKARYDYTNVASRKLTTLLMGCQHERIGTYGTHRVVIDDDTTHYVSDSDHIRYCRQYSEELLEDIRIQIAFLGVFFLGDYIDSIDNMTLTHPSVYCGIIDEGGLTHGEYSKGTDNLDRQQMDWDDTSESEYDPSNPPKVDPNAYDGEFHTGVLSAFAPPTDVYVIASNDFVNLISQLWDAMALVPAGDPLNEYVLDTFLTVNPIDAILSAKYFPLSADVGGSSTTVKLGKYDTQIPCKDLLLNQKKVDCGSVLIFPTFGNGYSNWIDRLCTITLYLPFCGSVSLDPELYMGRYVNVEYAIDLLTGNCSAYVSYTSDNGRKVITDIASGNCAIDMPITGIQHMTLDSQLYNATEQIKAMKVNNAVAGMKGIAGLGLSVASGNAIGSAASALSLGSTIYNTMHNEAVAEYNLDHTQLPVKMIGTTGACTGAMCELTPQIIFERPRLPDNTVFSEKSYAHTVGYACCISSTISHFHGYAEFASADHSGFSATASEKNAIMAALQSGVILP